MSIRDEVRNGVTSRVQRFAPYPAIGRCPIGGSKVLGDVLR